MDGIKVTGIFVDDRNGAVAQQDVLNLFGRLALALPGRGVSLVYDRGSADLIVSREGDSLILCRSDGVTLQVSTPTSFMGIIPDWFWYKLLTL